MWQQGAEWGHTIQFSKEIFHILCGCEWHYASYTFDRSDYLCTGRHITFRLCAYYTHEYVSLKILKLLPFVFAYYSYTIKRLMLTLNAVIGSIHYPWSAQWTLSFLFAKRIAFIVYFTDTFIVNLNPRIYFQAIAMPSIKWPVIFWQEYNIVHTKCVANSSYAMGDFVCIRGHMNLLENS